MDNDTIGILIDDLGRQVAQKSIEAAEWKARAITAEAALRKIEASLSDDVDEGEGEEAQVLELIKDEEDDSE